MLGEPAVVPECEFSSPGDFLPEKRSKFWFTGIDFTSRVSWYLLGVRLVRDDGLALRLDCEVGCNTWHDVHEGIVGPEWRKQLKAVFDDARPVEYGKLEARPSEFFAISEAIAEGRRAVCSSVRTPESRTDRYAKSLAANCFDLRIENELNVEERAPAVEFIGAMAERNVGDVWGEALAVRDDPVRE